MQLYGYESWIRQKRVAQARNGAERWSEWRVISDCIDAIDIQSIIALSGFDRV